MTYKLLASDIDETLLNDAHQIPEKNLDGIKLAREEYDVRFVPASGRGILAMEDLLKQLGLYNQPNEYAVSFNGGAVVENFNNQIISFDYFSLEQAQNFLDYGRQFDICLHIHTDQLVYVFRPSQQELDILDKVGLDYEVCNQWDISFLAQRKIAKLLYQSFDMAYLQEIEKKMQEALAIPCQLSYSSGRYMEINPKGVNKGKGLLTLAEHLHLDPKEIIVVGDNYNDLDMFQVGAFGVAPSNAIPEIKALADYVATADNNQGVIAEIVEKFIKR